MHGKKALPEYYIYLTKLLQNQNMGTYTDISTMSVFIWIVITEEIVIEVYIFCHKSHILPIF